MAAKKENIEMVRFLLNIGANVNAVDDNSWCPIHFAAKYTENVQLVQLLLDNGANTNAVADSFYTNTGNEVAGGTPMEMTSNPEVISLLKDRKY